MAVDYLSEFRGPVLEEVLRLEKARAESAQKVELALRKADSHDELAGRLESDLEKLQELAEASLEPGAANSYAKYMTSLRTKGEDLAVQRQAAKTLREVTIPRLREARLQADRDLEAALKSACRARLPAVQARVDELLAEIIQIHDSWIEAWTGIFGEFRVTFERNRPESVISTASPRIDRTRPGFRIVPTPIDEQLAALKKKQLTPA